MAEEVVVSWPRCIVLESKTHADFYPSLSGIGMDAYVMVFFQRIVDLSWIGKQNEAPIVEACNVC